MLTKISLKKLSDNPQAGDKAPCHSIVACDDKYENKTTVGKLWLKKGDYGNYLSGQLDVDRDYEGKHYEGYVILSTKEYKELLSKVVEPRGYDGKIDTGEVKNINTIPF